MKKVILALVAAVLVSPVAFAEDHDAGNKAETTVEHSTNPITGTKKTTKTTERKMKRGKNHAKVKTTETTKTHTDGEVEKSVDVEGESAAH
jgi:uncharacterized protein YdeI (BOF family)